MSDQAGVDEFPLREGVEVPPLHQRLTQERINAYADASGDHNPIHLDQTFARAAGLPSTIAHGLLTLGAACAEIELWAGRWAWTQRVTCRFAAPVPSGQLVSGQPRVAESGPGAMVVELDAAAESGERVLSKAALELRRLG